jgi:dTDP-4-dehydrorhamnose reductase
MGGRKQIKDRSGLTQGTPKVLITGGSGLLALNWAISMRDRYKITLALHKRKIALRDVSVSFIDLHSDESFEQFLVNERIGIVVNTAGLTNIEHCEREPEIAGKVNRDLAASLAKICYKSNVSFVHISTDHLFSGEQRLVSETETFCPVNVYGQTKADAETLVLASNPNALILRSNFFGWGTSYRRSFSDHIIDTIQNGDTVDLFEDVFFTPVIASELALIAHELLESSAKGIFNVVSDDRISKFEFGLVLAKAFNLDEGLIKNGKITNHPLLVPRPKDMSLSNSKVCNYIGRSIGGVEKFIEDLLCQRSMGVASELGKL